MRAACIRIMAGATLILAVSLGAGISMATAPKPVPPHHYRITFERDN